METPPHTARQRAARRGDGRTGVGRFLTSALMKLAALPVVALATGLSIYIRTSPFPPALALADLVARAGCPAAAAVGFPEARRGEPGYHERNDPDGDGIACAPVSAGPDSAGQAGTLRAGGAKFVRPKQNGG